MDGRGFEERGEGWGEGTELAMKFGLAWTVRPRFPGGEPVMLPRVPDPHPSPLPVGERDPGAGHGRASRSSGRALR